MSVKCSAHNWEEKQIKLENYANRTKNQYVHEAQFARIKLYPSGFTKNINFLVSKDDIVIARRYRGTELRRKSTY